MMTDRELLEMAAKAAGLILLQVPNASQTDADWWAYSIGEKPNTAKIWNPLLDDGDALRLAVKLRLLVECGYLTVNVRYNYDEVEQWSLDDSGVTESVHGDMYAATRRAIVRAAAEIGRAM